MKYIAFTLLILVTACGITDLRPLRMRAEGISDADRKLGRLYFQKFLEKSGGIDSLKKLQRATITFTDQWPSFLTRNFSMPWYMNGQKIRSVHKKNRTEFHFLNSTEKGYTWIDENNRGTILNNKGEKISEDDEDVSFYLSSYRFFFSWQSLLAEADIIAYAGKAFANAESYHLVFITWKSEKPDREIDQYLLWINRETLLVDIMQYTLRSRLDAAFGVILFSDYRKVHGILVPFSHRVAGDPRGDSVIHELKIDSLEF